MTPIPGDVCYFDFHGGMLDAAFKDDQGIDADAGGIDLAIFYGRNNLLLNGDVGWVPGNVWASITEGLDAMATACHDVWRSGQRRRASRVLPARGLMPAELSVGLAHSSSDAPGVARGRARASGWSRRSTSRSTASCGAGRRTTCRST